MSFKGVGHIKWLGRFGCSVNISSLLSLLPSLSFCFVSGRASGQRNHNPEKPGKQTLRFHRDQAVSEVKQRILHLFLLSAR